jgi:hypothetical protein
VSLFFVSFGLGLKRNFCFRESFRENMFKAVAEGRCSAIREELSDFRENDRRGSAIREELSDFRKNDNF